MSKQCDYCDNDTFYTLEYTHPFSLWYICKVCGEQFLDTLDEYKNYNIEPLKEINDKERHTNRKPISPEFIAQWMWKIENNNLIPKFNGRKNAS